MAHETGVASTPFDLLDKFRIFCVANGCTQSQWYTIANGSQQDRILHLVFGTKHFLFMCQTPGVGAPHTLIGLKVFTGVGTGLAWASYTLAGQPCYTASLGAGPYAAYDFFQFGGTITCVAEITAGVFQHFSFGNISKKGTFTGGEFVTTCRWGGPSSQFQVPSSGYHNFSFDSILASNSDNGAGYSGHLRCDYAGDATPRYFYFGHPTAASRVMGGARANVGTNPGGYGYLSDKGPNTLNLRNNILPLFGMVPDQGGTNRVYIGEFDGVASCDNRLLPNGTIVETVWKVFPARARYLTPQAPGVNSSDTYAYAYRMS